jgi:hypothetical protein
MKKRDLKHNAIIKLLKSVFTIVPYTTKEKIYQRINDQLYYRINVPIQFSLTKDGKKRAI